MWASSILSTTPAAGRCWCGQPAADPRLAGRGRGTQSPHKSHKGTRRRLQAAWSSGSFCMVVAMRCQAATLLLLSTLMNRSTEHENVRMQAAGARRFR